MVSFLVVLLVFTIGLVSLAEIIMFVFKKEVKKFEVKVSKKRQYYQEKKLNETRRD